MNFLLNEERKKKDWHFYDFKMNTNKTDIFILGDFRANMQRELFLFFYQKS